MPINIYIQDKDIDSLIEFYTGKLKLIKKQKADLDFDEKSTKVTLMQLRAKKQNNEENESETDPPFIPHGFDYSHKWTWARKISFAILDAGKPLSTNEIVNTLAKYEPDFEEGGNDRRKAIASISSTLSVKAGLDSEIEKEFIRIDDGTGRSKFSSRNNEQQKKKENNIEVVHIPEIDKIKDDDLPF